MRHDRTRWPRPTTSIVVAGEVKRKLASFEYLLYSCKKKNTSNFLNQNFKYKIYRL